MNWVGGIVQDSLRYFQGILRNFEVFSGDAVNLCRFLRISEDFHAFVGGFWSFLRMFKDFIGFYEGLFRIFGGFWSFLRIL